MRKVAVDGGGAAPNVQFRLFPESTEFVAYHVDTGDAVLSLMSA